jgi:hypothetical protein
VAPGDWEGLCGAFLASFDDLLACADDPELMGRELKEHQTAGCWLANHACHNAYHLGQIVLLRRMLGIWNPVNPTQ